MNRRKLITVIIPVACVILGAASISFLMKLSKEHKELCVNDVSYSLELLPAPVFSMSDVHNSTAPPIIQDTVQLGLTPKTQVFTSLVIEPVPLKEETEDMLQWNLWVVSSTSLRLIPKGHPVCISQTIDDALTDKLNDVEVIVNGHKYPDEFNGKIKFDGKYTERYVIDFSWRGIYKKQWKIDIYWIDEDELGMVKTKKG